MNNSTEKEVKFAREMQVDRFIQIGLFGIAICSILLALLRVVVPQRVDRDTALFLGVAVVALVIRQVSRIQWGDKILEMQQLRDDVKNVEASIVTLEKQVGPGSKTAHAGSKASVRSKRLRASGNELPIDPDDPNKLQFGGSPEANGRKLTATIKPSAGPKSSVCNVNFRVEATDSANPLTGIIKAHLHPSFGSDAKYDLEVINGAAEDDIVSYGAFTIGIEADEGKTRLELDLAKVKGGTKSFYEE